MRAILIALGVGIAIGMALTYWLMREQESPGIEPVRAGFVQPDGSVVPPRIPMDKAPALPHQLPRGAKPLRHVSTAIQPKPQEPAPGAPACSCEPVQVDMTVYRGTDGTGVVVSSPDGDVLLEHSIDIPIGAEPPRYRNFALVTNDPGRDSYSGLIGRRFFSGRVGLGLGMAKQEGQEVRPLVGIEASW